jgi:hypothetical protein
MGGACRTDGKDEKSIQYFLLKTPKGRIHLKYLCVDGKI